jgi:hypothetical protein
MALKTTIAAGLAAITMALFAGNAAEAKTRVVIGIGTGGWGAHSCWGWHRRCGWHPRAGYYYHTPGRVVIYSNVHNGGRKALSCASARRVVDRGGYNGVKTNDCRGDVYTFNARKNGKLYRVKVNARTGNIIGSGRM